MWILHEYSIWILAHFIRQCFSGLKWSERQISKDACIEIEQLLFIISIILPLKRRFQEAVSENIHFSYKICSLIFEKYENMEKIWRRLWKCESFKCHHMSLLFASLWGCHCLAILLTSLQMAHIISHGHGLKESQVSISGLHLI